jgi:hypothetical protein
MGASQHLFLFFKLYFIFIKITNFPSFNLIITKKKMHENTKKSLDTSCKNLAFKNSLIIPFSFRNVKKSKIKNQVMPD